ncbi:hypothetical protein EK21DRAFT_109571 [Setomelanomma holmii]|uniref:BZIP domain-containing protein n=1 Tax=Setomelanomma holmii TaxID=210430 RepID=A0A9P4HGX7_9PLEO|nr:hypothetical protein EK21DRAFT_109571 [Setomelanomma holmii]
MPFSVASPASPRSTSSDHTSDGLPARRKSRVSAEHTLNRVRENQRRHRARQRDHVASLEQKLADTEKLLAEARAEIASLKADREAANATSSFDQPTTPDTSNTTSIPITTINNSGSSTQSDLVAFENGGPQFQYLGSPDLAFLNDTLSPTFLVDINSFQMPLPPPSVAELEPIGGPPPCCSDTTTLPPPDEPIDPECSTCKTKPPPDPSESTTLCAQAFVLISQQNFRNLDPETIRLWLAQGLRRAQREGEGCRVENGALMRLLDYISGL